MEGEKLEKFRRAIAHFNRGEFFVCHEVLEEIWLAVSPEEKPFYQGLVQAAAAFHHLERGNRSGAAVLLARSLAKLERYTGVKDGLALEELRRGLGACLTALGEAVEPAEKAIVPPQIRWANPASGD